MSQDILKNLQKAAADSKNLSNQVIAKFILNNLNDIHKLTTSEIAKNSFSSAAGVIRFCKKLGLEGVNELKYQLKYLQEKKHLENFQIAINNELINNETIFFDEYLKIKQEATFKVHKEFLENDWAQLIDQIINAKTIFIFCFNVSYNASRNFVQRLRWVNKNVIHQNDMNSISSYIPMIDSKDVIIFLTLSGESQFVLTLAQQINKKCYTFALIGKKTNLINYLSNYYVVETREDEIWDVYSIRAQTAIQFLDYLYAQLIKKYLNEKQNSIQIYK